MNHILIKQIATFEKKSLEIKVFVKLETIAIVQKNREVLHIVYI